MSNMAESSSISSEELEQNVLKELECPVCFEFMQPPITICENGHNICSECKPNMYRCPQCRMSLLMIRNLALENLAKQVMYPCVNVHEGCRKLLPMSMFSEHKQECSYNKYLCPFAKISNLACSWNCKLEDLKKHVLRDHKRMSVEMRYDEKFYDHMYMYNLHQDATFSRALVVSGELFYAHLKASDGNFLCAVFHVGPKKNSSEFVYKFTLAEQITPENISWSLTTPSYFEDPNYILRPGNCIAFHFCTVQKFFGDENNLPFELKIDVDQVLPPIPTIR